MNNILYRWWKKVGLCNTLELDIDKNNLVVKYFEQLLVKCHKIMVNLELMTTTIVEMKETNNWTKLKSIMIITKTIHSDCCLLLASWLQKKELRNRRLYLISFKPHVALWYIGRPGSLWKGSCPFDSIKRGKVFFMRKDCQKAISFDQFICPLGITHVLTWEMHPLTLSLVLPLM